LTLEELMSRPIIAGCFCPRSWLKKLTSTDSQRTP
jgi:hypothetical protein